MVPVEGVEPTCPSGVAPVPRMAWNLGSARRKREIDHKFELMNKVAFLNE